MSDFAPAIDTTIPPELEALFSRAKQSYAGFTVLASQVETLKLAATSALAGIDPLYAAQARWLVANGYLPESFLDLNAVTPTAHAENISDIQTGLSLVDRTLKDKAILMLMNYTQVTLPLYGVSVDELIAMGMPESIAQIIINQTQGGAVTETLPETATQFEDIPISDFQAAVAIVESQLDEDDRSLLARSDMYLTPDADDLAAFQGELDEYVFYLNSPHAIEQALSTFSQIDIANSIDMSILSGKLRRLKEAISKLPDNIADVSIGFAKENLATFEANAQSQLDLVKNMMQSVSKIQKNSRPLDEQKYEQTYQKLYAIFQSELYAYPRSIFTDGDFDTSTVDSLYQSIIYVIAHNPNYRIKNSTLKALPFDGYQINEPYTGEGRQRYEAAASIYFESKLEFNPYLVLGAVLLGILGALHPAGDLIDIALSAMQGDWGGVFFNATFGMIPFLGDALKDMGRFADTADEVLALRSLAGVADAMDDTISAELRILRQQIIETEEAIGVGGSYISKHYIPNSSVPTDETLCATIGETTSP